MYGIITTPHCVVTLEVGEAKRILTDDTARRRYDQTGSTSERPTPEEYFGGGRRSYGSSYGPTAEDIFEQFFRQSGARSRHSGRGGRDFYADDNPFFSAGFGGGNPFFQPRPQQQQQYRQYTQSTHPFSGNFMGPLLGALAFLVLIFLISSIGRATSPSAPEGFSLWQTDHFSVPHYTADGLAYWLSPGYLDSATLLRESSRRSMDRKVFDAWYKFKESECQQDLSQGRRSGAPSRPKSCVEFDEIKLMRSQRSW